MTEATNWPVFSAEELHALQRDVQSSLVAEGWTVPTPAKQKAVSEATLDSSVTATDSATTSKEAVVASSSSSSVVADGDAKSPSKDSEAAGGEAPDEEEEEGAAKGALRLLQLSLVLLLRNVVIFIPLARAAILALVY